jgi:hypothetical protein
LPEPFQFRYRRGVFLQSRDPENPGGDLRPEPLLLQEFDLQVDEDRLAVFLKGDDPA